MNKQEIAQLVNKFPLVTELMRLNPLSWFNPNVTSYEEALPYVGLMEIDVKDASDRLARFAAFFCSAFPQTQASKGNKAF